ncbi:hypothetical protein HPB52_018008 [Rhipicephalus sanguineus]|uniref:Uncharacterized protein n=1 Tax=Rhipicephalus sanguineus TaxID=34632 RepID=A0A9D4PHN5_RHISA|nr:hypothetical protein HPB52_018008 [Rhipicephalus sanguineus]
MKRQLPRRQGGCCRRLLRLREENARFVLLAVVLLAYMILGALLFRAIEGPWEVEARERYDQVLRDFWLKYNGTVDPQDVVRLLEEHANASSRNLLPNKRPRWDFVGSFYFVGTVVSTIDRHAAQAALSQARGLARRRTDTMDVVQVEGTTLREEDYDAADWTTIIGTYRGKSQSKARMKDLPEASDKQKAPEERTETLTA